MQSHLSNKNLFARFVSVTFIFFALYLLNNRFQFFSATTVPITFLDQMVSFTPWAIFIYMIAYILPALVFFRLWSLGHQQEIIFFQYHFMLTAIIANLIFLFFPTTLSNPFAGYSYDQFLEITNPLTALCLKSIYSADRPYNCLPSLHVAASFVSAIAMQKDRKILIFITYFIVFWICLATMQVKQHVFYDILCGFILSLLTLPATRLILRFNRRMNP